MKSRNFFRIVIAILFTILAFPEGFSQNSYDSQLESSATTSKSKLQTIYSKSTVLEWDSNITIPSSSFNSATSGCILHFEYSTISAPYHNVKIYTGWWESLINGTVNNGLNNGGVIIPGDSKGTFSYIPTPDEVESLINKGLIVHGYGVKLNKITLETSVYPISNNTSSLTPIEKHGQLHVNGAFLYDSHNRKIQLYGMSTHGINFGQDFSQYVNKDAFKSLRDDWNTNCIRLALYPRDYNGYLNGGNKSALKKLICDGIDYAIKLGMYVIVDWHVLNYNPQETQTEAISFFSEISTLYPNSPNVLYEICNEPTNSDWNKVIKPYAEKVIPAIRKNSPDSIIIVGTNTWSQDIEAPLANPLNEKNVMYAFHFYAQTHTNNFRSRVEKAIKSGLPIFITEFGTCDASGNGGFNAEQSAKWFSLLEKYDISHMNWSLSNKAETASAIKSSCSKTSAWSTNDLTESGKLIYNHFRSLEN